MSLARLGVGVCVLAAACGRYGFTAPSAASDSGGSGTGDAARDAPNGGSGSGSGSDGGVVTMPPDAAAGTLLPVPAQDTYIKGIDTTTHGSDAVMYVGRYSGNGTNLCPLEQFDLTGLPASVTKATLRLYQSASVGSSAMNIRVNRVTQAWSEASATWSLASTGVNWTTPGGTIDTTNFAILTITPGALGYYDWDITTLVNGWLAGTYPNYGIELNYQTQPPTGNYIGFATRDATTATQRPQLLVTP
jgi:disaggregatase-related protein